MEKQFTTIDKHWLTACTGDPFADAGGYVIKELQERYPEKNILELIEWVTKVYVNKWSAKIDHFFLNSTITQSQFKTSERKMTETMKYFKSLINETGINKEGYCRITGRKAKLFGAKRDNSILSGSGKFINFHHTFENGIMLSKEAIIRFHFVPFGCIHLQGKIALIHSSNEYLSEFFAQDNCKLNLRAVAQKTSESVLKSLAESPSTALFRFIDKVLNNERKQSAIHDLDKNNSLTLYYFTNLSKTPYVHIYPIHTSLFNFYSRTKEPEIKEDWNNFIGNHYYKKKYKNTKYNQVTRQIEYKKKGDIISILEPEYQLWTNSIYEKLLIGKSILRDILNWNRLNYFSFIITATYLINIRNMKKETLAKIKEMTDFIFKYNDKRGIEKAIKELNAAKSSYSLRRFIIRDIVIKNLQKDEEEFKITVDDYANYLFPDTGSWLEVRDVLLIAICQKVHEVKMKIDEEIIGKEDNEEDFENEKHVEEYE